MTKRSKFVAVLLIMFMLVCDCMPTLADEVTHNYAEPVFEWEGNESCTATFACTSCVEEAAHEEKVSAVISVETQSATCLENGKTVYTAIAVFNEVEYKDVKEEVLEATGHNYVNNICDNCGDTLKPSSVIIMPESRTVTYSGKGRTLKVTEVEGSTGEVSYKYYVDEACTELVTKENSGAKQTGLYPTEPGIYYVVATVAEDENYAETVSEPSVLVITPRVVESMSLENKVDGVKISWSKVDEADGYILYRRYGDGEYKVLKTFKKNTTLSYKDTSVSEGVKYYYNMVAYADTTDDDLVVISNKRKTAKSSLFLLPTVKNVYSGAKISWKLVNDSSAKGFYVYRKISGESKYKKVATIKEVKKNNSWTDKNISNGKKVYYYVQAYYGKTNSTVRKSVGRMHYRLTRPTGERDGDYVKWNRNSKADGYEVYIDGLGDSYNYVETISSNKTVKFKYESSHVDGFKVRSYKKIDGKTFYSEWSKKIPAIDPSVFDDYR